MALKGGLPSSWSTYPTKDNPESPYKFASWYIRLNPDLVVVNRETYGFLDWLGDIGGLFDGLRYLFGWIVAPLASI